MASMLRSLRLSLLLLAVFAAAGAAAQSPSLQTQLQTQLGQTIATSCNASAASALNVALASMQTTGYTNLTCPQWTNVTTADATCIPAVQTAMLALVSNVAVVPLAYQSILTKQMTSMFAMPCPYFNLTLASVNLTAFSKSALQYSLASTTSTTVGATMTNHIVASTLTVNITAVSSMMAVPSAASTLVANMTSALAASLSVSASQLTLGPLTNVTSAWMLTVAYNISCLGTNATYTLDLASRAAGLGSSPILRYALSQLYLPPATVNSVPSVFVVGTLQLSSLNATLVAAAVGTTSSAVQMFYPGSTLVSLLTPPLDMMALVQSALTSTVLGTCVSAAQLPLLSALQMVQAGGLSSMTCTQWSTVAALDSVCLPAVRTSILGLISAVVPSASKAALTAQATALLSSSCPLYNVTLAQVNLTTFSVPALTAMLASILPGNTSVAVAVQDFAVSAQVVLSSVPSAVSVSALIPAFTSALAASLGVSAAAVALGTVAPGRRLLAQYTVPFTIGALGSNATVAAQKVALVTGLSAPTSILSLGLQQMGVPPVTLVAPPWVAVTGTMQLLGTAGGNLTAAASVLASALPRSFPGSTFVAAVPPPPPPPGAPPAPTPVIINSAGSDPTTFAAAYGAMLAAQCAVITSAGVLDAAAALLGAPRVACAAAVTPTSTTPPAVLALPPPSTQAAAAVAGVAPVASAASKLVSSLASLILLLLLQ